jgi:hypothetical protein
MAGKDSGGLTRGHFLQGHGVGDAAEEVAVAMELFIVHTDGGKALLGGIGDLYASLSKKDVDAGVYHIFLSGLAENLTGVAELLPLGNGHTVIFQNPKALPCRDAGEPEFHGLLPQKTVKKGVVQIGICIVLNEDTEDVFYLIITAVFDVAAAERAVVKDLQSFGRLCGKGLCGGRLCGRLCGGLCLGSGKGGRLCRGRILLAGAEGEKKGGKEEVDDVFFHEKNSSQFSNIHSDMLQDF